MTAERQGDARLAALRELVEFVRRTTPFYASTLAGFPLESWKDFAALPFLTGADLRANTPPNSQALLSRPLTNAYVFSTGGSTGPPKYTFRDHEDFADNYRYFAGLDVRPQDVAANLFTPGIWGTFTSHNKSLEQIGCVTVPIGSAALGPDMATLSLRAMKELGVNFVLGTPSIIVGLSKLLHQHGIHLPIEKIYLVGEVVYPSVHAHLIDVFDGARVRSMYGTVDAAGIGFQCRHLGIAEYHVLPYVHVDVVDSDMRPVMDGETGEVLVTVIKKRLVPIVRYRVGDRACFVSRRCLCGDQAPIFEVVGRSDRTINFASAHVPLQAIGDAVFRQSELSGVYQVRLDRDQVRDRMTIVVERRKDAAIADSEAFAARLRGAVLDSEPELAGVVRAGRCSDLRIVVVDEGAVAPTQNAGKINMLIDNRE